MENKNIVRKVILARKSGDMVLYYFQIGQVITPDTETGRELVKRLRLATGLNKQQAEQYVAQLAMTGLVEIKNHGCLSTEDGVLYFHLINEDKMWLDNHNYHSEQELLDPVRQWAKDDHDEEYVDSLTNEQFCRYWYFKLFVTEEPLTEPEHTPLEAIKQAHTIGMIYDNHEQPYCLYQDYDCIAEFDFLDEAQAAYQQAISEHPDSVIDILSADGNTSYLGQN